jgi:putative copper resistance protein D
MKNVVALLLTLTFFSHPGLSYAQETHSMKHEKSVGVPSYPAPVSPEDKSYSEFMHQLNGVFVLFLGILAILERKLPNRGGLLRWGWPVLFLVSGIYLMIKSDQESWPIGNTGFMESLSDPEVLQHKGAAAILLLLGLSEFFLRTHWRRVPLEWIFPSLAVSAGILLVMHSHAQHSFEIHLQHLLMSGTAIGIGVTKFLSEKNRVTERPWLFLILLLGLELLLYRE